MKIFKLNFRSLEYFKKIFSDLFWILTISINLIFKSTEISPSEYINKWIIWNSGQGQWVTHILPDQCRHFDFGGEMNSFKFIKKKLLKECENKENQLFLSHWDFDHYLQLPQLNRILFNICWMSKPQLIKKNKMSVISEQLPIKKCPTTTSVSIWKPQQIKKTNESSVVFNDQDFLIPGDSPIHQEKLWSTKVNSENIKFLILGHHGSKTSTGTLLLNNLPHLKLSIASAREKKYGHPHKETIKKLKKWHIPLLITEDWGNIHIYSNL